MEELRQLVQNHLGQDPVPLTDIQKLLREVHVDESDIEAVLASVRTGGSSSGISGKELLAWLYDETENGVNERHEAATQTQDVLQPPGACTGQALAALPARGLRQILKSIDHLLACGYTELGRLQQFLDKNWNSESETLVDHDERRAQVEEAVEVMMAAGITEVTDLKQFRSAVGGALIISITGQEPNECNGWMSEIDLPSAYTRTGYQIEDVCNRGISMMQLQSFGDLVKEVVDRIELKVSFVELIAKKEQRPARYVTHCFGTPFSQSLRMLQSHFRERGGQEWQYYWVDFFAYNQHRLDRELQQLQLGDFEEASFMRVLHSKELEGTVILLDARATPFARLWTMLEIFETINTGKKYDMATWLPSGAETIGTERNCAQAVLLLETATATGSIAHEEVSETSNPYGYSWSFPRSVVEAAAKVRFIKCRAARMDDEANIQEYINGREAHIETTIHKRFAVKAIGNAALDDQGPFLRLLLEEHPEMIDSAVDKFGHSAVFLAASQNTCNALALLIAQRASVHTFRQDDKATPVYIAAFKGHVEALKLLIAAKADVNATTEDVGATPALVAAERNNAEALQVLMEARADIEKCNNKGLSPASVAESKKNWQALELLTGVAGAWTESMK